MATCTLHLNCTDKTPAEQILILEKQGHRSNSRRGEAGLLVVSSGQAYRVTHHVSDPGWVDLDLGSSDGWWAASVSLQLERLNWSPCRFGKIPSVAQFQSVFVLNAYTKSIPPCSPLRILSRLERAGDSKTPI